MGNIKAKELGKLGYTNDKARSLVINILSKHFKHHCKAELIELLTNIKNNPSTYVQDMVVGKIAETIIEKEDVTHFKTFSLLEETGALKIFGGRRLKQAPSGRWN
jgi:tRNA-splicing ligase RtcB